MDYKIGLLFPGQGSQKVGMGKELIKIAKIRNLFERVNDIIGYDLVKIMFEGPESELTLTFNAQPAILLVSYALFNLLDINFDAVAGHSLGEYTANVSAKSLDFEDAIKLVHLRGKFMQEAVQTGEGAMYALIGFELSEILNKIENYDPNKIAIANYNSYKQIVISGEKNIVLDFIKNVKARRKIPLKVSAPFHSPLMIPAQQKLKPYIEKTEFKDSIVPIYTNIDGKPKFKASLLKYALINQVSNPVKWYQTIENMIDDGINFFVEVGESNVLTGLLKQIIKNDKFKNFNIKYFNFSSISQLNELKSYIKGE